MTLVKNTFYYSAALVYQKILGFVFFILIGRYLGVIDTGAYVLAISFTGLFFILADIGLVRVMIKKIAQEPNKVNQLYNQIFTFKLLLSLMTGSLIVIAAHLMSYQAQTLQLIYLAGLAIILDSFSSLAFPKSPPCQ